MGGPDDKSPLPDFSGSSPRGHQGRRGSLLGEHEIVGDIRTDLGMSGRFHPWGTFPPVRRHHDSQDDAAVKT